MFSLPFFQVVEY